VPKSTKSAPPTFSGERLRLLRGHAGLTAYRLAKTVGLTQTALAKIESGQSQPGYPTACKLADALGVGLDSFRAG
jgi:transcriptional regulator with XRE-family HTH domain